MDVLRDLLVKRSADNSETSLELQEEMCIGQKYLGVMNEPIAVKAKVLSFEALTTSEHLGVRNGAFGAKKDGCLLQVSSCGHVDSSFNQHLWVPSMCPAQDAVTMELFQRSALRANRKW